MYTLIKDKNKLFKEQLLTMAKQFNQLDELGLLKFKHARAKETNDVKAEFKVDGNPELIFIFANHNPRSTELETILRNSKFDEYNQSKLFDLRFYVASFAGYGLPADSMYTLDEFRKLCEVKKHR